MKQLNFSKVNNNYTDYEPVSTTSVYSVPYDYLTDPTDFTKSASPIVTKYFDISSFVVTPKAAQVTDKKASIHRIIENRLKNLFK